jgi:hypothetical protein
MSEENKALVRRWFAEIDKGNWQIVDDLVSPQKSVAESPSVAGCHEGGKRAY